MGYLVLFVTGFSSSGREVGVFYHFITLIFCLFFRNIFVNKAFDATMSKGKLLLFIAYNHINVPFCVCGK